MKKTNAMRVLDSLAISFRVESYEVDPEDLSAVSVADKVGLEPERVFKTLVVQGRGQHYFAVLPAHLELDLKAMASLAADKKMALVPLRQIQHLTGYIRGGVTVLAAKKAFPVFLDEGALAHDEISVSAGVRGQQIFLDPTDFARVAQAKVGKLGKPPRSR